MDDNLIKEAMTLMSKLTQDQILSAMAPDIAAASEMLPVPSMEHSVPSVQTPSHKIEDILNSPGPIFGAQDIDTISCQRHGYAIGSSQITVESLFAPGPKTYDLYSAQPNGKKEWIAVPQLLNYKKIQLTPSETKSIEKSLKRYEAILKASEKVGIPKKAADVGKGNVNVDTLVKTALLRKAASSASINMAMTAVFDMKLLIDGEVKAYLIKLGISGLYGGTVSGCSAWMQHPILGNSAVLGVLVGSAFGVVSLASTGDWARFGKNTGPSIVSSAGGWAGAYAGASLGTMVCGPAGTAVGAFIGGLVGGFAAHWPATATTNLAQATNFEMEKYYERLKEESRKMGWEPSSAQSPRDFIQDLLEQASDPNSQKVVRIQMTESMGADIKKLQHVLERWLDEDAAQFKTYVERLREAVARRE